MKRETESLIVSAQNQSIRTDLVKERIDKSQVEFLCRERRKVLLVSKLAQKEYKRRHDNLRK